MPAPVAERARAGRLGLLVLGLAMNDRSGRFARIFAHSFPDAHHVAASGIDDLAAALLDLLLDRQLGSERRARSRRLPARDRKCPPACFCRSDS